MKRINNAVCLASCFLLWSFIPSVFAEEMSVSGNIFTSVYPKLTIKVDPELVYIGAISNNLTVKSQTSPQEGQQVFKYFVFAKEANNIIEKALWIYFSEVPMRWKMIQNEYGTEKNCFAKNKLQIGRYKFDSCSLYVISSKKGNVSSFLESKGYKIPKCVIQKRFGMYPSDTKAFSIEYCENIESHGFSCSEFSDHRLLSDKAQAYMSDFEKRCKSSFASQ